MADAPRDNNFVPTLLGASSADGKTPVPVYANPTTHRLLVDLGTGITGPGASTDNAMVRWDGTTGTTIQNSGVTLDDTKTGVVSTVLFSQTATKTVANTVTETTLDSTGVGSKTIPAGFLIPGRTFTGIMSGIHSSTGNTTIRIRVKFAGTTVLDTGAVTSGNSTNTFWEVRGTFTCYTAGATGTAWAQGFYTESGGGQNSFPMTNTSATTIDTTASGAFSITVQWGTADPGNTMTCTNFYMQALN